MFQFVSGSVSFSPDGRFFATRVPARLDGNGQDHVRIYATQKRPRLVRSIDTGWYGSHYRGFTGWAAKGHALYERATDGTLHRWDPAANRDLGAAAEGHDQPHARYTASADGDLQLTRRADGRRVTIRELAHGKTLVVDDRGCVDGDLGVGAAELTLPSGQSPTPAQLASARRPDLARTVAGP